ncbi:pectinesterase inhibitor 10-like [Phragmites australis]|uniref:pectinesterase inhibitor 10-like n=1 Tax=Phragmites australis TaxID=29695 RepID=UPI002D798CEB|nr:pectinesterase inhibitor 10-like [Phragmites australis]
MEPLPPPPPLLACLLLLLLAAAVAPPAAAVCVPRKPGSPGKPGRPTGPTPVPPPKPKPTPPAPAPPKLTPIIPGADIVKSMCLKTDYPDVCLSSIAKLLQPPPPPGGKRLDGAGVLRLAMSAVRGKAAEAKNAAGALAANPKTPPLARGPLQDCVESYDDIAYSLDNAEKAMAGGDRDTTGTMLDTVRTDVDTCDQGFEEREELTPLMAKHDAELAKLASNCLAIATAAGLR